MDTQAITPSPASLQLDTPNCYASESGARFGGYSALEILPNDCLFVIIKHLSHHRKDPLELKHLSVSCKHFRALCLYEINHIRSDILKVRFTAARYALYRFPEALNYSYTLLSDAASTELALFKHIQNLDLYLDFIPQGITFRTFPSLSVEEEFTIDIYNRVFFQNPTQENLERCLEYLKVINKNSSIDPESLNQINRTYLPKLISYFYENSPQSQTLIKTQELYKDITDDRIRYSIARQLALCTPTKNNILASTSMALELLKDEGQSLDILMAPFPSILYRHNRTNAGYAYALALINHYERSDDQLFSYIDLFSEFLKLNPSRETFEKLNAQYAILYPNARLHPTLWTLDEVYKNDPTEDTLRYLNNWLNTFNNAEGNQDFFIISRLNLAMTIYQMNPTEKGLQKAIEYAHQHTEDTRLRNICEATLALLWYITHLDSTGYTQAKKLLQDIPNPLKQEHLLNLEILKNIKYRASPNGDNTSMIETLSNNGISKITIILYQL